MTINNIVDMHVCPIQVVIPLSPITLGILLTFVGLRHLPTYYFLLKHAMISCQRDAAAGFHRRSLRYAITCRFPHQ